ncbi:hypothetical protein [Rathayibacter sp. VKM Ac-2630]|uniref:hypothetical protein n=1 Tax=Rathayibacter sp. VKM Ac-2630 TaxID=1938617 RepID=UPI000981B899|nr:hypothetical protein [Rathayibacter sp. VKM Ac-2630]OOB90293.1 hypothetical protein B0T42_12385 [Rathayibacter sp. VKM Ac-2630]
MLPSFARMVIIRKRYPKINDQGTLVPDYSQAPDVETIAGCWLEPITSTEVTDDRLAVATGYQVVAPAAADVNAEDRVQYAGADFEVEGEPMRVPSPTGALAHTQFVLRRWTHGQ